MWSKLLDKILGITFIITVIICAISLALTFISLIWFDENTTIIISKIFLTSFIWFLLLGLISESAS